MSACVANTNNIHLDGITCNKYCADPMSVSVSV